VQEVFNNGEVTTVYNLRVADYHTYFVGSMAWGFSVWAHNAGCPNPDGPPGKKDHRDAVDALVDDFNARYPASEGYEVRSNKSILNETGINRRPDAAALKDGKVLEVGEVARVNQNGSLVPREALKQSEYEAAGIPSTVVEIPK
jgi:hypothetical protein